MNFNRRQVLRTASGGLAALSIPRSGRAQAKGVKALVFDTFGTVVDWRGSIIAEGAAWGQAKGLSIDWAHFADRWRNGYAPAMEKVRKGELPWTKLDALHRMYDSEKVLFSTFLLTGLREMEVVHLFWTDVSFELQTVRVTAKPELGFYPKRWEEREVPIPVQ